MKRCARITAIVLVLFLLLPALYFLASGPVTFLWRMELVPNDVLGLFSPLFNFCVEYEFTGRLYLKYNAWWLGLAMQWGPDWGAEEEPSLEAPET